MSHHNPRLEEQLAAIIHSSQGEGQCKQVYGSWFSRNLPIVIGVCVAYIVLAIAFVILLNRAFTVLDRPKRTWRSKTQGQDHLLIVLGSGGHTAEMMGTLSNLGAEYLLSRFSKRTWVVSSGDGFSAARAGEFEELLNDYARNQKSNTGSGSYDIITVSRARNIHQSIYTTPISALRSLWDCIQVLRGRRGNRAQSKTRRDDGVNQKKDRDDHGAVCYPDLILTNGPGTAVILIFASILLLVFGYAPIDGQGCMRSIYIESWARVKTLSLSARILQKCAGVSRFLVQWKPAEDQDVVDLTSLVDQRLKKRDAGDDTLFGGRCIEYVGAVVT